MVDALSMIIRGVLGFAIVVSFISLNVLFLTWMERKVMARVHVRYGPNRAGKFGLLQPIADAAKLILKEDIIPEKADKAIFTLAPPLAFAMAVLPAVAIPMSDKLWVTNLNTGVLFIMAVASLSTLTTIMAAWGSNNKYSLLGGMRAVATSISYELPLVLSLVGVVALAGTMNLITIVENQDVIWYVFWQPIGFMVFSIAAVAEMGRIPFDLPESESELVSGFHTEYSGMKFGLIMFAEYIHMIVVVAFMVAVFLGGWTLPFISTALAASLPAMVYTLVGFGIFMAKMYIIIFVLMWIRGTIPRIRFEDVLATGWKGLIPLAIGNIFITGIMIQVFG